ncbi:LOW QUALITY PROTEIN: ankyrin repeat domain-containing protein 60 [Leptosomus discolor]
MLSLPLQTFSVQLCLAVTNEIFSLPRCQNDLTVKKLKSHLESLTGILLHFQQLQYLDEVDLPDESTFKDNDLVPGGTITMCIWQDGRGHLVAAVAEGETMKVDSITAMKRWAHPSEDFAVTAPHAELLGPEQKKEWVTRTSVALAVASHRDRVETAKFLLRHGAGLHPKTPLGKTALHCTELLRSCGARALGPGGEGQTGVSLARLRGQNRTSAPRFASSGGRNPLALCHPPAP